MYTQGYSLKLRILLDKLMQTRSQAEMQGQTSFNARFDELEARLDKLLELSKRRMDFERVHRVGVIKDNVKHPRAITFELHHHHKKLEIWKKTRGGQEGCNFKEVTDISIQLRKKRAETWPLREQLHRLNLKTYIRHPTILCVDEELQNLRRGQGGTEAYISIHCLTDIKTLI